MNDDTPIMEFPTRTQDKPYILLESKLNEYKMHFPNKDVMAEFNAALQWLIDNPTRRKKSVPRFLTNWLNSKRNQPQGFYRGTELAINSPEYKQKLMEENPLG